MNRTSLLGLWALLLLSIPASAQEAWLVWLDGKEPRVEAIEPGMATARPGLVVWSRDGKERWQVAPAGWTIPAEGADVGTVAVASLGATRGPALTGSSGLEFGQMTVQLDQVRGAVVARDLESSFLTPSRGGRNLGGDITIRRMPRLKGPEFPADVVVLTAQATKKSWKLPFAAGDRARTWQQLETVARDFPRGLPAGTYTLRLESGGPVTTFSVEPAGVAGRILAPLAGMRAALANPNDPLVAHFALDHLLSQTDDDGIPLYLADALEQLERSATTSAFLKQQRERLTRWLETPPQERAQAVRNAAATEDSTGIAEIDLARDALAKGAWADAQRILTDPALAARAKKDARSAGLLELYRAVAGAEAGAGQADQIRQAFTRAVELLAAAPPADRVRALSNWADYLQQEAQDHLYNHALRMAAGVDRPLASVLAPWAEADRHYREALKLADSSKQNLSRQAVHVNLARLNNLLGDFLRTLDARDFAHGESAARAAARQWAERSLERAQETSASPLFEGMAQEILAQIAYRLGEVETCRTRTRQAQDRYLDAGFLGGVENLQRLLALTAPSRPEALKHFRVAHLISESLRQRLPADRVGATQAGFFARKAWVLEKMVELLLEDHQPREALRVAEQARARALQDLLLTSVGHEDADDDGDLADPNVAARPAILRDWPTDTAALEFFLGAERAYVFLVTRQGEVRAYPLAGADGKPISSRALIAQVQRVLRDLEGQAGKMYQRVASGRGFDHQWQDDLHNLFRTLIPAEAWQEVRQAATTVVVPQHILHYFPFSALVTAKDPKERTKREMPAPRFWLDEPGQRIVIPSLAAWRLLHQGKPAAVKDIAAVGLVQAPGADALPGVDEDLKNLKSAFGPAVRRFLDGEKATVGAAGALLKQPGLVFVATHGFNDADRPLQSFLLLLPDKARAEGDGAGHLTAETIFRTPVKADVVVMSACYSGLGDRSPLPGDDLFGLQRALLQSGARSVVAGLWDVYDGTAPQLMNGFFERFAKGQPVALALQDSQRDFLSRLRATGRTEPWLHPYFWAVYSVIGDERVRFGK